MATIAFLCFIKEQTVGRNCMNMSDEVGPVDEFKSALKKHRLS